MHLILLRIYMHYQLQVNKIYVETCPLVSFMFNFNFMTNLALSIYVQSKLITCFPQISLVLLVHFRITRLVLLVKEVEGKMSKTGKFLSSDKLQNLKILAYTVHFQNNQSLNKCTQVDATKLL